jgi:hypothetical protein
MTTPANTNLTTGQAERPHRSRWRWTHAALRATAGVQTALVFTQALLAGHLLTGSAEALTLHREVGLMVISWVALGQLLLAILAWRPGRGPGWPLPVVALLVIAVVFQIMFGFEGRLTIHIPLGVTILATNVMLLVALRRPGDVAAAR